MKEKGYYDLILKINEYSNEKYKIKNINDEKKYIKDIDQYLLNQINNILLNKLKEIKDVNEKINFLNKMIINFNEEQQLSNNILLQINDNPNKINYQNDIRLIDNHLFTNQNEQELINQLNQEIKTADEVYFIYPFISKSILNKINESFKYALKYNIKIKFITTTFDDMALFVNLYELEKLIIKYSNIEIRIEDNYEKRSERIHIKAAIFKRKSGFSTAIIGSSNLTYKGMMSGREWNIKINQFDNFNLYQKIFYQYQYIWNDNLVNFNDEKLRINLLTRIKNQNLNNKFNLLPNNYSLYDFQKEIVKCLKYRRKINKNKHLVIMATGTGKTVVAAFDYLNQIIENNGIRPSILFLAHQKEIVDQAILTFRKVLNDYTFGDTFYDGKKILNQQYLFATIQSIYANLVNFNKNEYQIIIFDEAHHIAAKTFEYVFKYFNSKQVIGLTATPERQDNKQIINYFDNEFAYELRLWDAINQKLLCPFDYYCIDDITINLSGVDINNEQLLFKKLNNDNRNQLLLNVINDYIGYYANPTCLIFCITTEHAKIIANFLKKQGFKAHYLTSEINKQRTTIINDFKKGKINYLCVVNMFNEGIDIAHINIIILLRPTNSKTIYLQQLGRGLRKIDGKNKLEVYDLIANIDKKYDITIGIKNLYNTSLTSINSLTENAALPYGCTITLEKRSQSLILQNLQKWYENKKRIHLVIKQYYQNYKESGLIKILDDYEISILQFYNYLDDFYLKVGMDIKEYNLSDNDYNRNKNILKQFLFLNDYDIVNYFYLRLNKNNKTINYGYDNLLICSLLYEVTSMNLFLRLVPNYNDIDDLVVEFINRNKLIVNELCLILKYKLKYEILNINEHISNNPLLSYKSCFTVRQALCAVQRVNFIKQLGALKIIAFQAGYLTFDKIKSVIFADIDGNNYGKLTKYDEINKLYYWSIPENKKMHSKLVKDIQNNGIIKFLFLNKDTNKKLKNLYLKLYDFIGIGEYVDTITNDYITAKFLIKQSN